MSISVNELFNSFSFTEGFKGILTNLKGLPDQNLMCKVNAQLEPLKKSISRVKLLIDSFSASNEVFTGYDSDTPVTLSLDEYQVIKDALDLYKNDFGSGITLTLIDGSWVNLYIHQGSSNIGEYTTLSTSSDADDVDSMIIGPMVSVHVDVYRFRNLFYRPGDETPLNFLDILYQQKESVALNEALAQTIYALRGGADHFVSLISNTCQTAYASVKSYVVNVINAYNSGGFKGVVGLLSQFFSSGSTLMDNQDGTIKFTNNLDYIPQQYIVGLIPNIITTASALIGAIASFFNPYIGAGIALIGGIVGGALQSINYDASATKPGINASQRVFCDALPWAVHHGYIGYNNLSDSDKAVIDSLLTSGIGCYSFGPVDIIIGVHSYNDDGSIHRLGFEVHPRFIDYDTEHSVFSAWKNKYSFARKNSGTYMGTLNITLNATTAYAILDNFSSLSKPFSYQIDGNQRFTNSTDIAFKQSIGYSIGMYIYILLSMGSAQQEEKVLTIDTYQYPGQFEVDGTTTPSSHDFFTADSWDGSTSGDYWPTILWMAAPIEQAWTDPFALLYTITGCPCERFSYDLLAKVLQTNIELSPQGSPYGLPTGITTANMRVLLFDNHWYTEAPFGLPNNFDWIIMPAKYDINTFIGYIILSSVVAVAATVAVTVSLVKFKKWRTVKQAESAAKVEKAWAQLTNEPTVANAVSYRKAVKAANLRRIFIGGPKYNAANYWGGGDDGSAASLSSDQDYSAILSTCETILSRIVGNL